MMNKRCVRKLIGGLIVLLVVPLCLLLAWILLPEPLLEGMAKSMTPTLYPDASFVSNTWDGGSAYQSKGQIYVVRADIQQVRDWMNERSTGFSEIELSTATQNFSSYERCNQGVVARALTRLELGPADFGELFPCASVWLSADISSTAQTTMTVWVRYPRR